MIKAVNTFLPQEVPLGSGELRFVDGNAIGRGGVTIHHKLGTGYSGDGARMTRPKVHCLSRGVPSPDAFDRGILVLARVSAATSTGNPLETEARSFIRCRLSDRYSDAGLNRGN